MDADQTHLQLYTLEYQKAAERYDNIYRSMWTIFSYLTAVAAGILAFGADKGIEWHGLICIAAIPLLFWFWTTYLPLDRYGNGTANRLRELEGLLNARFQTELKHFTSFAHPLSIGAGIGRAICKPDPYSPKAQQAGKCPWVWVFAKLRARWELARKLHRVFATLRALWHEIHRARFATVVIFLFLHLLVLYEARESRNSVRPLFPAATPVGRSQ